MVAPYPNEPTTGKVDMSNLSKITAAHTAYVRAVENVAAAEYARDDAYNAFEQARAAA